MYQWFKKLFGREKRESYPLSQITPQIAAALGLTTGPSSSGVCVSEQSALTLSTFWRGARVISEKAAVIPFKVYRKTDTGREEAAEHPTWSMLHDEANPNQSKLDFLCQLFWDAVVYGNGYAEIVRSGSQAAQLVNVAPWRVSIDHTAPSMTYVVDGKLRVDPYDLLVIKGPSPDQYCEGYRLCQVARETFGFALATETYGASAFKNNLNMGGWFTHPGQLSEQAKKNILDSKTRDFGGVNNRGKWDILEEGMTPHPNTPNNEHAQYVEVRKANAIAILQYLGVPPSLVGILDRATWGNYEQEVRSFYQLTLDIYLSKYESEVNRKIIRDPQYYGEFVREAVVQLDPLTQSQVWQLGVQNGWYEPNDIRRMLNLAPLADKPKPQEQPQVNDGTQTNQQ